MRWRRVVTILTAAMLLSTSNAVCVLADEIPQESTVTADLGNSEADGLETGNTGTDGLETEDAEADGSATGNTGTDGLETEDTETDGSETENKADGLGAENTETNNPQTEYPKPAETEGKNALNAEWNISGEIRQRDITELYQFSDDFEGYTAGAALPLGKGWNTECDPSNVTIQEENGSKYLQLHSAGSNTEAYLEKNLKHYEIQFDVRFDTKPAKVGNGLYLYFNDWRLEWIGTSNETLRIADPSFKYDPTVTYPAENGKWYTIKMQQSQGTVRVKVWERDSEEKESWTLEKEGVPDSETQIKMRYFHLNGGTLSLDNVRFQELAGPEPGPEPEPEDLVISSFMADGLTQPAEIDQNAKTVKLRFAADVDLSNVRPYFYYNVKAAPSVHPYDVMDLSSGKAVFDGWTILAGQNSVMKEFYVNPSIGKDTNSGESPMGAFRTMERAQDAVRALDGWNGDVIVHLAKGQYNLTETLEFDSQDGAEKGYSVIYQGAGAENSVISSGILLQGWKESNDVPGVTGVYEIAVPEGVEYSRDLYVGNTRANLASRTLNSGEFSQRNNTLGGYTVTGTAAEMANWKNQSDIEFYYDIGWTSNVLPVKEITNDGTGTKVIMKEEPFQASNKKMYNKPDKPTGVQNAFEALDEVNEWYFDRTEQKIYYIPAEGQNPDDLFVVLPTLDKLVDVKGKNGDKVNGLAFKDIGFRYTSYVTPHYEGRVEMQAGLTLDPEMEVAINHDSYVKTKAGVSVSYAEGMRIRSCTLANMSAGGLDYDIGVTGSTVEQCRFEQIGASGIQVGGVKVRDAQPYAGTTYDKGNVVQAGADPGRITEDILIYSNILDTIGNNFRGSIGIFGGYVRDLTLSCNKIDHVAYSAISIGWGWGIWDQGGRNDSATYKNYYHFDTPSIQERYVVERNSISDCMTRLKDGGAIYTLSDMPGSIIRGNYIHEVPLPYGAIYLDEGAGGLVDISSNAVFNVYRPYFYHLVAHYADREKACLAAQHDNFFSNGAPVNPNDEAFLAIEANAGCPAELTPPVVGAMPVNADKEELEALIAEAEEMADNSSYTPDSAARLNEKIAAAKEVWLNDSATKEEIFAAIQELRNAINSMLLKADKTALQKLLSEVQGLDLSIYTEESVKRYERALANARAVMENEALSEAEQAVVDEAVNTLKEAVNALERKSGDSGNTGDNGNSGGSGNTGGNGNSGGSGNTGGNGNSGGSGNTGSTGNSGDKGNSTGTENKGNYGLAESNSVKTGDDASPEVWAGILGISVILVCIAITLYGKKYK